MENSQIHTQIQISEPEQKIIGYLKQYKICHAAKVWKRQSNEIDVNSFQIELDQCLVEVYRRNPSAILSAYHIYENLKQYSKYTVDKLLKETFRRKNYVSLLKEAHRLNIYNSYSQEIETALKWCEVSGRNDAHAWRSKFQQIQQISAQQILTQNSVNHPKQDLANDLSDFVNTINDSSNFNSDNDNKSVLTSEFKGQITKTFFNLPSISKLNTYKNIVNIEQEINDSYILSQIAKEKLDRANQQHEITRQILVKTLNELGYEAGETKLIDTFSIIKDKPAIFEVKSIHQDNEREQVRHAVSQLYEYQYLYNLNNASLWIVFSKKPEFEWLIDYLINSREINVLWITEKRLSGISFDKLEQ